MRKITIEIPRGELERLVGENTAYTGVKMEDEENSGVSLRIATVSEDGELLSRLLSDSAAIVGEHLKEFVTGQKYDGRNVALQLEVSGSYDPANTEALKMSLTSAMADFVTARWFRLALPGRSNEWEQEGMRQLGIAERNLFHRRKPRRSLG